MTFTVVMLYPGSSAEDEFPALERVIPDAAFPVHHTWEGPTDHDVESLRALGSHAQLTAAGDAVRRLSPDAVMWACTSGSFVYGAEGVVEQAAWIEEAAGAPSSSTSLAFVEAIHALGISRVVVAATYPAVVADYFTQLLADNRIEVLNSVTRDVPSGEDAGLLGPDFVREMMWGAATDHPGTPIVVPDTALHTVDFVPALEREFATTVLTANQVTAWWGLRMAGWRGTADGIGQLFARAQV